MPAPGARDTHGTPEGVPYYSEEDTLRGFYKQELTERSVRVTYYLVTGYQFLDPIFGRKDPGNILKDAQDIAKEAKDNFPEKSLIHQLVKSDRPMVLEGESYRFSRHVWQNLMKKTEPPLWKINMPFSALLSRSKRDSRFRIDDHESGKMWFNADNATLLKYGWLALNPVLENLAIANVDYPIPFSKAGFIKWQEDGLGCGMTEPGPPPPIIHYEKAFIIPRKIKFIFLDIENIGNRLLEGVTLEIREWAPEGADLWKVYDEEARARKLAAQPIHSRLIPRENLKPHEHFIVPLGILLDEYNDSEYKPKDNVPILYFGPTRSVEQVALNRKKAMDKIAVRRFDHSSLSLISHEYGVEGASCPYVYTQNVAGSEWRIERQVLIDANSQAKFRIERIPLKRFNGRLLISEEEPETSFIDYVAVEATDEAGNTVTLPVSDHLLQKPDNQFLRLEIQQSRALDFPAWRVGLTAPTLVIGGYYLRDQTMPDMPQDRQAGKRRIRPRWQGASTQEWLP